MAVNDITFLENGALSLIGSAKANVAAGATKINPGEPVAQALGGQTVTQGVTNTPVVATDFWVGIATSTSTQTASVAGTVEYMPLSSGVTYLISPKVAATFDTQAKYDALVGKRVLIDLTTGVFTILAADGATYGCVIAPLEIAKFPGKVAFKIRAAVNTFA